MAVINSIIEYFRGVAESHRLINGYKTGELYEANDAFQDYPLLWLELPIQTTYGVTNQQTIGDYLNFTIGINIYDKYWVDENGNSKMITESGVQKPSNEISNITPLPPNALLEQCTRIFNHIVTKMINDIDEGNIPALNLSITCNTVERVHNDDVYGVEGELTFQWFNEYKCEAEDFFETNQQL